MNSLFPFIGVVSASVVVGGRGGERGKKAGGVGLRKASIVSDMESNWRASEDAWLWVPLVRGLGWTPFRMGCAAGGILQRCDLFLPCVCAYGEVEQGGTLRGVGFFQKKKKKKTESRMK